MADYFTQLTHLPMLTGPVVLSDCIAKGVERGLFGYALGDGEARKFDTIGRSADRGCQQVRDHRIGLAPPARTGEDFTRPEKTVVVDRDRREP